MSEWIFLATESAANPEELEIHFGRGPFRRTATAPRSTPAFYHNNFDLSAEAPWLHPTEYERLSWKEFRRRLTSEPSQEIQWIQPFSNGFEVSFHRIKNEIARGHLLKAVPHLSQIGYFPDALAASERALNFVAHIADERLPRRHLFGWCFGEEAYVGLSPELLFQADGLRFETMALAGTAPTAAAERLRHDPKEIYEHQLVIEGLEKSLANIAQEVRRAPTEISKLGSLCHLLTRLTGLFRSDDWNHIVRSLHPTPALGPYPKIPFALERSCPYLGAPLGFRDGRSLTKVIVTLRGIRIFERSLQLSSGCGITENSVLERELEELALKRRSILETFGLAGAPA